MKVPFFLDTLPFWCRIAGKFQNKQVRLFFVIIIVVYIIVISLRNYFIQCYCTELFVLFIAWYIFFNNSAKNRKSNSSKILLFPGNLTLTQCKKTYDILIDSRTYSYSIQNIVQFICFKCILQWNRCVITSPCPVLLLAAKMLMWRAFFYLRTLYINKTELCIGGHFETSQQ